MKAIVRQKERERVGESEGKIKNDVKEQNG